MEKTIYVVIQQNAEKMLCFCMPGKLQRTKSTATNAAENISVYRFPQDNDERAEWITVVPNTNLTVNNNICELH